MPEDARHKDGGIRVVITGKDGAGKTTLAALLSHLFAREGKRVLVIDSDPRRNLAEALGIPKTKAEGIVPVVKDPAGRSPSGTGARDLVARCSVQAGENLRLLVMGGEKETGEVCPGPEYTLLAAILQQMKNFPDDVVILDTAAGLEQFGRAISGGFTSAVVVTDATYNAVSVARKSAALAHQRGIENVILVINRAENSGDIHNVCGGEGGIAEFTQTVILPVEPKVNQPGHSVVSLTDSDSALVSNAKILMAAIAGRCERWSPPAR